MVDNLESEGNLGRHKLDIQEESLLKPIQLIDSMDLDLAGDQTNIPGTTVLLGSLGNP